MSRPESVRDLIVELWTKTRIDWSFATDRIADTFRRHKELSSRDRRDVAETLYGMIRQARRLDFALEPAAMRLPRHNMARELARYLAYCLLEKEIDVPAARAALPLVDWATVADVDARISKERNPVRRLGLAQSIPDWLARLLIDEYGVGDAHELAAALNKRAPLTIRANTLKISRDDLLARLAKDGIESRPTPRARHGLVLETRINVFGLPAFQEGLFEVQDEASQLVAELVNPGPRSLVIDACAGAGGKTLALGALMGGKGRLVATDIGSRKLEELRRRARRAGLSSARAIEIGAAGDWPDEILSLVGKADRVLVDAPCSGIGALRRNPEARWRLDEDDLIRLPREQEAITRRAATLLAPGGRLIYATCTILRAENEAVIERLLASDPTLQPVPLKEVLSTERVFGLTDPSGLYLKLLPHKHDTDGFFAAVLKRGRS